MYECVCVCACVSSPTRMPGGLVDCCVFVFLLASCSLFSSFVSATLPGVFFRLIGDLESRANSRQDVL